MAPEVFTQNYDSKCDLWSLAIIIFMKFSGELPFDINKAENIEDIYNLVKDLEINWSDNW